MCIKLVKGLLSELHVLGAIMLGPFFLACGFLYFTSPWGLAGEPKTIFVGVPEPDLAAEVSEILIVVRTYWRL